MALGALLDAGLDLDQLRADLARLGVAGWELSAERTVHYGIAGTQARAHVAPQTDHRHLSDIEAILAASTLPPQVRGRALSVFRRLAEAEGAVHGMDPGEVHFHEVGALDAIVDVVGVVVGLDRLGIEGVYASPLPLGSGWIDAAHGRIPVPGPAVLQLLGAVRAPVAPDDTPFELVTPTGAALLAEFATFRRPAFRIERAGYGFGSRDTGRLNAVRVWIGDSDEEHPDPQTERHEQTSQNHEALEQVLLLQTNLDDQPGEQVAFATEQLLAAGALDVWWQVIGMKKGRAALLLSVLAAAPDENKMVDLLFRETTSLGVRRQLLDRWVCDREIRPVPTPWGPIQVKLKRWRGAVLGWAPEYEDCARVAREHDTPLQTVYRTVQSVMGAQFSPEGTSFR
jgi:uncharacterized protein (TIGR00299 family) protein